MKVGECMFRKSVSLTDFLIIRGVREKEQSPSTRITEFVEPRGLARTPNFRSV